MPIPCFALLCGVALLGVASAAFGQEPAPPSAAPAKKVFAHYMVCHATYGESVEAYQREIKEAQAAGIDGFALNCGAWNKEPHYIRRSKALYEAARKLGTGFLLFFSADGPPSEGEVVEMVKSYARHPNQFRVGERVVLSTFTGAKAAWREKVFAPLKEAGIELFFVPFFYPDPVSELPNDAAVAKHVQRWAETTDGLFFFGAAGLPKDLAACNASYARHLKAAGKLCMASYTPHYWGMRQPDRRYYESQGGEGTALQWEAILQAQPDWVEIVTWNDWIESSYVSPIEDPAKTATYLTPGFQKCHAGYLELSKYFIEWYKTGQQPPIRQETLFYFYRTHPKDLLVAGEKPVTGRHGEVEDVLYLTTLLKEPAQLLVKSGEREVRLEAAAGLRHRRVPFAVGAQHFEVLRNGQRIIQADGPAIEAQVKAYDFVPVGGFAVAAPEKPTR
jgi:glucan endo-1,3-alpha-glucosidase